MCGETGRVCWVWSGPSVGPGGVGYDGTLATMLCQSMDTRPRTPGELAGSCSAVGL